MTEEMLLAVSTLSRAKKPPEEHFFVREACSVPEESLSLQGTHLERLSIIEMWGFSIPLHRALRPKDMFSSVNGQPPQFKR